MLERYILTDLLSSRKTLKPKLCIIQLSAHELKLYGLLIYIAHPLYENISIQNSKGFVLKSLFTEMESCYGSDLGFGKGINFPNILILNSTKCINFHGYQLR